MRKDTDKCQLIEGELTADGLRFAIIVSRFNSFITERLLGGAVDALERMGASCDSIKVVKVPGSLEIPVVAQELGKTGDFDAIICLGAVIRGETPHFDYVASESSKGVASASLATGVPTIYGILTCNTLEQAIDRAGAKGGNKGFDAALTAIEMANLLKDLRQNGKIEK
ncbi:MAG: 6,7-dimethyl-8-ribityllumazine synthase [Bryobacterales bacterium]|nr:6,7-dimethyl-8-ribityllumazine synthase [Bryobacterales bacterium]